MINLLAVANPLPSAVFSHWKSKWKLKTTKIYQIKMECFKKLLKFNNFLTNSSKIEKILKFSNLQFIFKAWNIVMFLKIKTFIFYDIC